MSVQCAIGSFPRWEVVLPRVIGRMWRTISDVARCNSPRTRSAGARCPIILPVSVAPKLSETCTHSDALVAVEPFAFAHIRVILFAEFPTCFGLITHEKK